MLPVVVLCSSGGLRGLVVMKKLIEARGTALQIPFLVHFTRASNLPSIMTHGIFPITKANEIGIHPEINDHLRLDGHRGGTSVSIAFPNAQMFYKLRQDNPTVDWAVLVIPPLVLWNKDCAFCLHNAADRRVSGRPIDELRTDTAFGAMYDEIEGHESRKDQSLKVYDPTDVQAEVLVFDTIEPPLILAVVFQNASVRDSYAEHLGDRKLKVHGTNKGMFASRGYVRKYR
jgi:hypothetical protein